MDKRQQRLENFKQVDLYPVITSTFCAGRPVLDVVRQVLIGGAKIIQLREKEMSKRALFELAQQVKLLADRQKALLIINDHLDVAMAVQADGVHLGQDDLPVPAARQLAPQLIIGLSTHDAAEIEQARQVKPDYINIGPIFKTQTKAHAAPAIGIAQLQRLVTQLTLPFTVMGGIKTDNIKEVIQAGAKKIALVTEVTEADDIVGTVRALRKKFTEHLKFTGLED